MESAPRPRQQSLGSNAHSRPSSSVHTGWGWLETGGGSSTVQHPRQGLGAKAAPTLARWAHTSRLGGGVLLGSRPQIPSALGVGEHCLSSSSRHEETILPGLESRYRWPGAPGPPNVSAWKTACVRTFRWQACGNTS